MTEDFNTDAHTKVFKNVAALASEFVEKAFVDLGRVSNEVGADNQRGAGF